ncbi:MAG: RNA polymerase sigma-70 factor (ECF subfamily) [Paraglaciecola sp.]
MDFAFTHDFNILQHLTDTQLVHRTLQRKGDATLAFAHLYGRYQRKVSAYVGAKVGYNHGISDDVLQDTFMLAWHKLEQLKDHDKFFPWLITIARNTALDVLRDKKRVNEISHLLSIEEGAEEPFDLTQTEQLLATLAVLDREIVVMRAVLESTFEDISQQLNLTLSATKMRYYRALDKLKAEQSSLENMDV